MNNPIATAIQMMQTGGNPQSLLMNMAQQKTGNNSMMQNMYGMMQSGNMNGIEQLVRNICQSKNIDADQLLNQVKNGNIRF